MGGTYIGIDMGTSSVKLLLTDEGGKVLGQSSRSYELLHPHEGWSEIEPETWYQSMLSGLTELMTGRNPKDVRGIGVTGQMHTLILLDADGNSVRPAILWNDKRTKEDIPFLKQYLNDCTDGEYLSGIMSTGSPASALYWVSRREPERFAECRHFLIGPDYLVYRLTGTIGTDSCEASTSCLYSISNRQWCPRMRDLIGLTDDMYPPVRSSAVLAGPVLPEIRGMFGWDERVCVITGTGDNPATALSTGCLDGGYPVLSLGTSGVLMFPVKKLEDAGLVVPRKEQYYTVYSLNRSLLEASVFDIAASEPEQIDEQQKREGAYRQKVIDTFFEYGKLKAIPVQRKKKRICYEVIAEHFTPGKVYNEKELNDIIAPIHEDYCTIRRDMISEGLLDRNGSNYVRKMSR